MHLILKVALLVLEGFAVLFVGLHNWVPLGSLNDVKAVRSEFPRGKLVLTTLFNLTPVAIGFVGTAVHVSKPFPEWLLWWLWITYGLGCYGSLKAWWIPYLIRAEPERAQRYQVMYRSIHSSFPERNGVKLNTLHLMFDVIAVAILILLALLTARPS